MLFYLWLLCLHPGSKIPPDTVQMDEWELQCHRSDPLDTDYSQTGLSNADWNHNIQLIYGSILPNEPTSALFNIWTHWPVGEGSWWAGQWEACALRTVAALWTSSSHSCAEVTIWVWEVYTLKNCTTSSKFNWAIQFSNKVLDTVSFPPHAVYLLSSSNQLGRVQ